MLRIGLCDDEAPQRDALQLAVERLIDEDELCFFAFSSGEGLLRWLEKHPGEMDLLFLDIEMQGLNGMETAKAIRAQDQHLILVFVTGYADYVFDGYSVDALDYIIKPVKDDRLEQVLKRALGAMEKDAPKVYTLQNTEGLYRVPYEDILYFYSDRRHVTLVSRRREYAFYGKLNEVAQHVGDGFVRIHNRYLVRAAAVDAVEGNSVCVKGETLPISRAHRADAMLALAQSLLEA